MSSITKLQAIIAAASLAVCGTSPGQITAPPSTPTPAFTSAGRGIEVGIAVSDMHRAASFYRDILGLREIDQSDATSVYAVGASTIRLHALARPATSRDTSVMAVNGFRLLTILIEGPQAVSKRFVDAGLTAPQFSAATGPEQFRLAFTADPEGNVIELVAFDKSPPGGLTGFQVGLTVSDASASRDFYGQMLGLTSRTPLPLPPTIAKDTLQYMFRADTAMIKFWAPPGTRTRNPPQIDAALGIRYISIAVTDLQSATSELRSRGATLTETSATRVRLADPDGNIIELTAGERR